MKMVFSMIFSAVVTMSLTGGVVIVLVLLMRLLLARVPKIFSYLLWGAVLLRLLCPVSFTSGLSVFQVMDIAGIEQGRMTRNDSQAQISAARTTDDITGGGQNQVPAVYAAGDKPNVNAGHMPALKTAQEETGSNESMKHFTMRGAGTAGTAIWVLGVVVLWLYSAVSVLRLKRQLIGASPDEKSGAANIFLCDYIHTAFVMGVLRPRIYLPTTLTESERRYILLHEKTHIKRGDHIFRLLAFFALSLHWFNPLVWCAFFLSEKDMEMSCDEAVMRQMGTELRAAYSASLLNLASGKKVFAGAPLGFGEGSVKSRIKNIMRYKNMAVFAFVPVLLLVGIALVALGSNPVADERENSKENNIEESLSGNDPFQDSAADEQESSMPAESESSIERIWISPAVVTDKMVCDIEGPVLDYADGETLIFHHDFGLFVYDMGSSRLDSSVNLKELGCLDEKGQLNCEIFVTEDGKSVYLHPNDTEELYQYDVAGRRVTREVYDSDYYWEHNMDFFVPLKQTKDCVDPDYTVWRSKECVTLRGDEQGYLYLESGSGMVMDLYYVVEAGTGGGERVRFAKIFDDQKGTGGLFEYAAYTGYLDECTAWDGHEQFAEKDYDGDGRIDRVYRTNLISDEMCTYRIEFGNGDMLETKQLGMGMPQIRTCDLDGDGTKEILMQLSYGFNSDPNAYGETALFAKKNGSYEPLMPPQELCTYMKGTVPALQGGNDNYTPCITVVCKQLGEEFPEWASMPPQVWDEVQAPHIHVTVKELTNSAQISETVPLNQATEYLFEEPDAVLEHRSVCYKTEIVRSGRQDFIEYYFEAVNKWSLDEIVVTAACENGVLHVVGSRYVHESEQSGQLSNDKLYNVSPEEVTVIPAVEPLSFEEASKKGTVEEYDNETGGMLPGLGFGMWYSVRTDGVEYIYGKMDKDNFNKGYELYSWALWDDSHQLANGLKVGMTRDEALACCPRLLSIGFETTGLYSWNGTAYPDFWTEDFDEILIAKIEDNIENMPVCLALMMKGDLVKAITKYEMTAG